MKILYGGSFNPPTLAHFQIALPAGEISGSGLEFLPVNNFYEKDNLKVSGKGRKCWKSSVGNGSQGEVNSFESTLDKYYGTWHTLRHFPDSWFVIGTDNLASLPTWINYPAVAKENRFLVIPRPGVDSEEVFRKNPDLEECRNNFLVLADFPETAISSSLYRKTRDEKYLLPEVAEYIRKNYLYKE